MKTMILVLMSWLVLMVRDFGLKPEIIETGGQNEAAIVTIKGNIINETTIQSTEGTGFIVSTNGIILTNKHVVENINGRYRVITSSGDKYGVESIYRDPKNDIAVIKIDPNQHQQNKLTAVNLGSSEGVQVGQQVVALGDDPGKIEPTKLTGAILSTKNTIIAGDSRNRNVEILSNVIQTDLKLIPGNSGSPLLDQKGEVVGINTATSRGIEEASYAIPIDSVKTFMSTINGLCVQVC